MRCWLIFFSVDVFRCIFVRCRIFNTSIFSISILMFPRQTSIFHKRFLNTKFPTMSHLLLSIFFAFHIILMFLTQFKWTVYGDTLCPRLVGGFFRIFFIRELKRKLLSWFLIFPSDLWLQGKVDLFKYTRLYLLLV